MDKTSPASSNHGSVCTVGTAVSTEDWPTDALSGTRCSKNEAGGRPVGARQLGCHHVPHVSGVPVISMKVVAPGLRVLRMPPRSCLTPHTPASMIHFHFFGNRQNRFFFLQPSFDLQTESGAGRPGFRAFSTATTCHSIPAHAESCSINTECKVYD